MKLWFGGAILLGLRAIGRPESQCSPVGFRVGGHGAMWTRVGMDWSGSPSRIWQKEGYGESILWALGVLCHLVPLSSIPSEQTSMFFPLVLACSSEICLFFGKSNCLTTLPWKRWCFGILSGLVWFSQQLWLTCVSQAFQKAALQILVWLGRLAVFISPVLCLKSRLEDLCWGSTSCGRRILMLVSLSWFCELTRSQVYLLVE